MLQIAHRLRRFPLAAPNPALALSLALSHLYPSHFPLLSSSPLPVSASGACSSSPSSPESPSLSRHSPPRHSGGIPIGSAPLCINLSIPLEDEFLFVIQASEFVIMTTVAAGVALGAAVGTALFAGVTGVANSAIAWQGHKKGDHYEGNEGVETGNSQSLGCLMLPIVKKKKDYVEKHHVCNLKSVDMFVLTPSHMQLFTAPVDDSAPTKRHHFTRIRRKFHGLLPRNSRRLAKMPPDTPSLGGTVKVTELQNTNHHLGDKKVGLTTAHLQNGKHSRSLPPSNKYAGLNLGRQAAYTSKMAEQHWATLQPGSFSADEKTAPPTIVVANWTFRNLAVFVKPNNKEKEAYYRNYQVLNPNLALFENEFKEFVVFSGIIQDGKLTGANSQIVLVADNRKCRLKSDNTWTRLGFERDPNLELPSKYEFLAMKRAAIFGIAESLYKDPTLLDVTMLDGGKGCQMEFAQVVPLHEERLEIQPDNAFSVFAFNANEYSNERVLVG